MFLSAAKNVPEVSSKFNFSSMFSSQPRYYNISSEEHFKNQKQAGVAI
jgi:hypothetical protein